MPEDSRPVSRPAAKAQLTSSAHTPRGPASRAARSCGPRGASPALAHCRSRPRGSPDPDRAPWPAGTSCMGWERCESSSACWRCRSSDGGQMWQSCTSHSIAGRPNNSAFSAQYVMLSWATHEPQSRWSMKASASHLQIPLRPVALCLCHMLDPPDQQMCAKLSLEAPPEQPRDVLHDPPHTRLSPVQQLVSISITGGPVV